MKKLVVLLMAALFFVGCEKKDEGKNASSKKASTVTEAKIECLGLTIAKPSDVKISEAGTSCNLTADSYRMAVMKGAAYAKPTLQEALKDNSASHWENAKGEETANGYYITYDQGSGKNVMALQKIGGNDFFFTGAANDEKGQASLVAIVKSVK